MQNLQIQRDYKPIAFKLRMQGRTQIGLWRKALSEANNWSLEKFRAVCTGWRRDEEIEAWLIKEGFEVELRKAQKLTGIPDKKPREAKGIQNGD